MEEQKCLQYLSLLFKGLPKEFFSIISFHEPFLSTATSHHRRFPSNVIESQIAVSGNGLQDSIQTTIVTGPLVGQRQNMSIFWAGPSKLIGST